jgi:hypothetical protein
MNRETLGWWVFGLGAVIATTLLVRLNSQIKHKRGKPYAIRACICSRHYRGWLTDWIGRGVGALFISIYLLLAVLPGLLIGDPIDFSIAWSELPWYGWLLLAFFTWYTAQWLIEVIKFAKSGHSWLCVFRRAVLGYFFSDAHA